MGEGFTPKDKEYENTKRVWGNKPHIKEYQDTIHELHEFMKDVLGLQYKVAVEDDGKYGHKIVTNFFLEPLARDYWRPRLENSAGSSSRAARHRRD